jgi:hypothetical protein
VIDTAMTILLKAHAGVGDRVYSGGERVEVTRDLPKVVYTLLGDVEPIYTDDGQAGLVEETCQVDCFAAKPSAARLVLDNLRVALDGYSGTHDATVIARISFQSRPRMEKPEGVVGAIATAARYTQDVTVQYRERMT